MKSRATARLEIMIKAHPGMPFGDIAKVVDAVREKYPEAMIRVELPDCCG